MMYEVVEGVFPSILKKMSNFFPTSHLHESRRERVKANLDGLSEDQLKLVLRLVKQMHKVNKGYSRAGISNNN